MITETTLEDQIQVFCNMSSQNILTSSLFEFFFAFVLSSLSLCFELADIYISLFLEEVIHIDLLSNVNVEIFVFVLNLLHLVSLETFKLG
jgi:hypothetical protein